MAPTDGQKSAPSTHAPGDDPDERRRHRRVDLALKARVLKQDGEEEPCLVVNISAGGVLLKAVNPPQAGEKVVVYIDEVGRHEGYVIRSAKHHFAVDYRARPKKAKRAADTLTYALNNKHMHLERRANPRIKADAPTVLTLANGDTLACEILDVSLTGASVAVDPRPPLGAELTVGRMAAKVVRVHEKGVAVVFTGGGATKMEEVITNTTSPIETKGAGAGLAPQFGKKGVSA